MLFDGDLKKLDEIKPSEKLNSKLDKRSTVNDNNAGK